MGQIIGLFLAGQNLIQIQNISAILKNFMCFELKPNVPAKIDCFIIRPAAHCVSPPALGAPPPWSMPATYPRPPCGVNRPRFDTR